MKKAKYLAFDCETGGFEPDQHSLLTAYFAVLDEDLACLDEVSLELNANSFGGVYRVTAGAMEVNKIDLVEHDKRAIHPNKAREKLVRMLEKYRYRDFGGSMSGNTLMPLGHNVDFDIGFIKAQLLPEPEYRKFISHRKLCTSTMARFLKLAGKIDSGGSLENLCKGLGVEVIPDGFHNAEADTRATVECLKKMLEMIK